MDWTPAQIARLTDLWIEGHSCAEIARRMFISKNAVIGKSHRLVLPKRPSPITNRLSDEERAARKAVVKPPRTYGSTLAPLKSLAAPTAYERAAKEIRAAKPPKPVVVATHQQVSRSTCQWIESERPLRFCDAPANLFKDNGDVCHEGVVWCARHRRAVYTPVRRVA